MTPRNCAVVASVLDANTTSSASGISNLKVVVDPLDRSDTLKRLGYPSAPSKKSDITDAIQGCFDQYCLEHGCKWNIEYNTSNRPPDMYNLARQLQRLCESIEYQDTSTIMISSDVGGPGVITPYILSTQSAFLAG